MELKEEHLAAITETATNVKHLIEEQQQIKADVRGLHQRLEDRTEVDRQHGERLGVLEGLSKKNGNGDGNGKRLDWKTVAIVVAMILSLGGYALKILGG